MAATVKTLPPKIHLQRRGDGSHIIRSLHLREISPLVFGSAPITFMTLADAMELRGKFVPKLKYMGYGVAALSDDQRGPKPSTPCARSSNHPRQPRRTCAIS